jgi:hypothetical protein
MSPSPKYHQPYPLDPRYNFLLNDHQRSFASPAIAEPTITTIPYTTTAATATTGTDSCSSIQEHFHPDCPHLSYYQHIVLPSDTVQGICIRYKISWRRLGQINGFSGKNLALAPKILWIPKVCSDESNDESNTSTTTRDDSRTKIGGSNGCDHVIKDNLQDQSCHEFMVCYIMAKMDGISNSDAKRFCEMYNWDLEQIVQHGLRYNLMYEKYGQMVPNEKKENHYYFRFNVSDLEHIGNSYTNPWMKLRTSLDSLQSRDVVNENDKSGVEGRVVDIGIEMKDMSNI